MKPAKFQYHRPESIEEVVSLLDEYEDAELMAGNQSLGILMSNRLATPDRIIDLNRVTELDFVRENGDNVEIGALTRHRTIERSDLLSETVPMLPEAAEQIAGPSVRNRGTLGGSIGEADPAGNYPTALTALDATLNLRSVDGEREVDVRDYFLGYMFTELEENELIVSASVPTQGFPMERSGMAFVEQKPAAQTWPTISAASAVRVDDPALETPVIEEARLALGNAGEIPLHVKEAEERVEGGSLDQDALEEVEEIVYEAADPDDEVHADAEYKREIAGEYAKRSLRKSYDRSLEP